MSDTCRVWIVNHYADAPDRPSGTRHFDLARQLVARGRSVTIFASSFSHVTQREERLQRRQLFRVETVAGVDFVWLRTFPYKGNTWRRQLNMLSFVAAFLMVQARFPSPDAVIGSTVHPFAALGAWLIARLRRARFLFEIRDLWPQTLVDLGAMRQGSVAERALRTIEAFLVRRAAVVITLLPGMLEYLKERGLPSEHVIYLPNGVDIEMFDAYSVAEPDESVRIALETISKMRGEGRFVFGYVGAFGRVNHVDVIVEAAALAEARCPGRVGLVLVGDGPERSRLEQLADDRTIVFAPAVAKRSVPPILRSIDAAVVHFTTTPVYRYGVSFNKLFEYMAAGRPVVFACESAYDPVAATRAGLTVPSDDPGRLAEAFITLADAGPEAHLRMGVAGRSYVIREHNIALIGARLANVLPCEHSSA